MTNEKWKLTLRTIVEEVAEMDDIPEDADFNDDLGIDSMLAIEILARIEKKMKISVPESGLIEMHSLNDAYRIVGNILQAAVTSEG
ncbi:acyl carrier protein [Gorillibacterium massiliense]|uniref:acyl carrier protein n=1 Tax=Gorillibacterium massiliense TaxID=1280390 RepID=UPI0004B35532|nr:acyl carrier protein [Gorillibacterium massiliense]